MTAKILDGSACSAYIKTKISKTIEQRQQQGQPIPGLDVILVGDNPASISYVSHKQRDCQQVGIHSRLHHLTTESTQAMLVERIQTSNADNNVHGILLQLPLPKHIAAAELLELINPNKDVDGFHPYNLGRLVQRRPLLRPCTPYGIMTLLNYHNIDLEGKHVVIIGASNIVGRPMALEILLAKSTVTVCHRFTRNLAEHVKQADVLISAIGKPNIVDSQWIQRGAVVVDVGFSRLSNGKISGDIEFTSAAERASWITPVPGGVGPMTRATLLENTLLAADLSL